MRLVFILAFVLPWRTSFAQEDPIASAMEAFEHKDYASAEQILQARLRADPKDGQALGFLAVVLDQEKKYGEADQIYRRALADSPHSPALLNNYGNHLLAAGKDGDAWKQFLEVINVEPGNVNALVQLARIALERKSPAEALAYLNRIPAASHERPDAVILRMQADYELGRREEAEAILGRVAAGAESDPNRSFALGVALASAGQYDKAESFFSKTLEVEPANFEALYDLGLAASHAGHKERALQVLEQAAAREPENVNVLYDLAAANVALNRNARALELLAKASRLVPQRADVLQLEARTAAALGYFADAEHAWDEYLKIAPRDEVARRERAFAQTAIGDNTAAGLAEMTAFVRRHPGDATAHCELGTAESPQEPNEALKQLNRALALQPDLTAARIARGLLLYREGKPEAALFDFQSAVQTEPENGAILDRLGETYLVLDRPADALPVLRKAAALLPSDSAVLLHLARTLAKTGNQQEAATIFERCRELGPSHASSPHPAGLVEFLGLPQEEQQARYRAGIEHTVENYPENAEAQVRYLAILLADGEFAKAASVVHMLSNLKLSTLLLTEAVDPLLATGHYSLAKQLLNQNAVTNSPQLHVDLAIAEFHESGAQAALDVLNTIPRSQWNGDCYLLRAQMLQAQNQTGEAVQYIQQAIRANPTRPDLYRQGALLLIEDHHVPEAVRLLGNAVSTIPANPDLSLLQALTSELAGDHAAADGEFKQVENRWPEWYKGWLGQALVLELRGRREEAQTSRQAAIALGAPRELAELGTGTFDDKDLTRLLPLLFPDFNREMKSS